MRLDQRGRLVIPATAREKLGIELGDSLRIDVNSVSIKISKAHNIMQEMQLISRNVMEISE